ncbi:NAD(P)/FAD-dependent oxidoreductase [Planctomicrobium piriforme]|uniref:Glycine/D-amino acid oxidase n=1 Tax=Planctomicrobium piriforme TaxID=1576369 RepID=A0A1I3AX58_9PLAN|nr:FAD-dependent oxidoreductase [Planctomicrobium piriforme]SFH54614.1 Glycine/D-amino acid oxidase [Planctomicrobium piriforme]
MDLKSTYPFWPIKNGLPATYPFLKEDVTCDVVILGAGITGTLVADELSKRGLGVVLLDRRDVGQGSTAATTGLLQYEIDVPLCDLIELVGKETAERAYRLCLDSISQLETLAAECKGEVAGFDRKTSIYVASRKRHVQELEREQAARYAAGIPSEFLTGDELQDRYGLNFPVALVNQTAAVCDAFGMTHGLLQNCLQRGAKVFDRTDAVRIRQRQDKVEVTTDRGPTVFARHIIFATGYESQNQLRKPVAKLKSTYAFVSQPLEEMPGWNEKWLLWESARPYLYLRTTQDRRVLLGGEDDPFRDPARRDRSIPRKTQKLLKRVSELFPKMPLEPEYAWAGTFGETKDGLPYIGASPDRPWAWFALGFGGNGITFSAVAAKILADLIVGDDCPDAELFRFDR